MANRLSVIIPTSGRRKDITRTIDAVLHAPGVAVDEVIVVIDAQEGAPLCDRVARWLWTGEQKGPAGARNLGAASAKNEVLVFLDDDVHPDAGALNTMCRLLESGSDAVCAVVRPAPEVVDNVYLRFAYGGAAHGGVDDRRELWWHFCTSLAMVRRDVFERAGGFDERFREAAYEDVELAFRLCRAGGRIEICRETVGWHRRRMDRQWFIARGERQGAQLARLLEIQPAILSGRHSNLCRLGVLAGLFACGWRVGQTLLPVIERLPGTVAVGLLKVIHACGVVQGHARALRQATMLA